MLSDAQWAELEPLVEACRPHAKVPPSDLRRTVEAIIWRCTNGTKWRSILAELGPWWKAAQIFIRWARLGVWDRLLAMAQERGVELGMAFLDGTSIRAHAKAAGASKKGGLTFGFWTHRDSTPNSRDIRFPGFCTSGPYGLFGREVDATKCHTRLPAAQADC